ncbi:hypothetical protein MO973_13720 [Paenibacillus sp. TRM 82003]|nr:hypothetical protein [Paenibacillus sp. TRM 82003]
MTTMEERRMRLAALSATEACERPLLDSGLWVHDDIRTNFYYASYLFAAAVDEASGLRCGSSFDREAAKRKAEAVFGRVLALQDKNPDSGTYGHWPLGLAPSPKEASPHPLPAELMGSLIVWFYRRHAERMTDGLRSAFEDACLHLHRSGFYRRTLDRFNHHEAKYTAAKLVFGWHFQDEELFKDGQESLLLTLNRMKERGLPEYGALPWFWHWIQAFTCAFDCVGDEAVKDDLARMLSRLWTERARFYLPGAWVGARSRSLPLDLPRDGNVGFDYVQFGDFALPDALRRVEYAGFLAFEAPEEARRLALDRSQPRELRRAVYPADAPESERLHSYVYVTERFAVGGMRERVREFDNEQHRWEVTLPLSLEGGVNRLYFFRPGEGYREGDPRHEAENGDVMFYRSVGIAYYAADVTSSAESPPILGVLPPGNWVRRDRLLCGEAQGVYLAVHTSGAYDASERPDRWDVALRDASAGVVVEAVDAREALAAGIDGLAAFADAVAERAPTWSLLAGGRIAVDYRAGTGDALRLDTDGRNAGSAYVNGAPVDLAAYEP